MIAHIVTQKEVSLPFLDNFDVNVQIRIQPRGNSYMAYLQTGGGKWQRFPINLQPDDIQELNTTLQQTIEQTAAHFTDADEGETEEQVAALTQLARKGTVVFKRIFSEGGPRERIRQALQTGATIQITSEAENFFIPWELLYDGPLTAPIDAAYFWGMRHIISRAIIQDARPGDEVPPVIQALCPRVGLVTYAGLEHVIKYEVPIFEKLHQEHRIHLATLRPLDANQPTEIEAFCQFLGEEMQILHSACHAYGAKLSSEAYLLISDEFRISVEDFHLYDLAIKHNPLVVLNACLTGTRNPQYTSNWAALFWERGARGVLATEFHVPDWFASVFIEEVYKHLLAGMPIGESLLTARRHFWKEQRNPLGLGYALYSSPMIRIVSEKEKIHE